MKKLIASVFLILLTFSLLYGQEKNDFLSYYDSELMKINYQTLSGLTITYQGYTSTTTMGVSEIIKNNLCKYKVSTELFEKYEDKNELGNIMLWGGLGLTTLASICPAFFCDSSGDTCSFVRATCVCSWVTGIFSTITGSFLISTSQNELVDSVNYFNRKKVINYK